MFKNYLTIAWRYLLKNRQFTLLNLIGLSTGLTGVLLIWLWVKDEMSVDKFHQHDKQLFQVMEHRSNSGGINTSAEMPGLLAESLPPIMPEVQLATVSTPLPSGFRG
ncbi:hypothetical protein [Paraflavitalea speifideaquila]|uniref:hypothetical protein n=1 Tax=Paraflavitalea speifideaquila TaxID=3076558 RepID=UPI0028E93CB2|nr:hypothetical protein [Paraflavitalea speifideiaquila]